MAPLTIIFTFFLIQSLNYNLFKYLLREDGVIEYLTSVFYLVSSVISLIICIQLWKHHRVMSILYSLLTLFFIFVCGEEISWGQRIFDFETPKFIAKTNQQGEFNIHNNSSLHPSVRFKGLKNWHPFDHSLGINLMIIIGLYGSLSWMMVFLRGIKNHIYIFNLLSPGPLLMFYFLPGAVFQTIWYYLWGWIGSFQLDWRYMELSEFLVGVGFLLFVTFNYFLVKDKSLSA